MAWKCSHRVFHQALRQYTTETFARKDAYPRFIVLKRLASENWRRSRGVAQLQITARSRGAAQ